MGTRPFVISLLRKSNKYIRINTYRSKLIPKWIYSLGYHDCCKIYIRIKIPDSAHVFIVSEKVPIVNFSRHAIIPVWFLSALHKSRHVALVKYYLKNKREKRAATTVQADPCNMMTTTTTMIITRWLKRLKRPHCSAVLTRRVVAWTSAAWGGPEGSHLNSEKKKYSWFAHKKKK